LNVFQYMLMYTIAIVCEDCSKQLEEIISYEWMKKKGSMGESSSFDEVNTHTVPSMSASEKAFDIDQHVQRRVLPLTISKRSIHFPSSKLF